MSRNNLITIAQRLREYVGNPHHIDPMSDAFKQLISDASEALSQAAQPQGEPVAWMNVATGHVTTSAVVVMDWDDEKEKVQSLYAEQPAPAAAPKCERCKGWGFRDDPETGIDAGCGTCNGTGKEPID